MKKSISLTAGLWLAVIAVLMCAGCGDDGSASGGVNEFLGRLNDKFPPTAPSGVRVDAVTAKSVALSWLPVAEAEGYRLYYVNSPYGYCDYYGSAYSLMDSTSSTSYIHSGLTSNSTHCYKVSAYNNYGETSASTVCSAKTLTIPSAPANVTVTAVSSDIITVSWSSVSGAAGYVVYRDESYYGTFGELAGTKSLSYTDTGLESNTTYYYKVAACNAAEEIGVQSSYKSGTTKIAVFRDSLYDSRDGNKLYKAVKIGNQTWMAENMNYKTDSSWCYGDADSNCVKYGRLYAWNTAKSVCPNGWHLPSTKEWEILITEAGGSSVAAGKLKSANGWGTSSYDGSNLGGTDDYGFSALPGGYRSTYGYFTNGGSGAFSYWWVTNENGNFAYYIRMGWGGTNVYTTESYSKNSGLSVRCLKN